MMQLKTGTLLSLMLALAVLCNQIPDAGLPYHIAQLLLVGGVYIARDYLQTLIGDYRVLLPMAVLVLVIWTSSENPYAYASGLLIGLMFGWATFTQERETPMDKRMLMSGLIACTVDSGIYLSAIGQMDAFVFDTAIKVVPLLLLHTALRAREWRTNQTSRKG